MDIEKLQQMEFFKDQDLTYAFDGLTKVLEREVVLNYVKYLIKKNQLLKPNSKGDRSGKKSSKKD